MINVGSTLPMVHSLSLIQLVDRGALAFDAARVDPPSLLVRRRVGEPGALALYRHVRRSGHIGGPNRK